MAGTHCVSFALMYTQLFYETSLTKQMFKKKIKDFKRVTRSLKYMWGSSEISSKTRFTLDLNPAVICAVQQNIHIFSLLHFHLCWPVPSFLFWSQHMPCKILVPRPEIKPVFSAVEAWSPNHWTTRKSHQFPLLIIHFHKLMCGFVTRMHSSNTTAHLAVCEWTEQQMYSDQSVTDLEKMTWLLTENDSTMYIYIEIYGKKSLCVPYFLIVNVLYNLKCYQGASVI